MRIFILEDNVERMKTFRKKFFGNIIFHANNVEDGKKILSTEPVECIFLDHDLDDKASVSSLEPNTGYQLAKWIKDNNIKYNMVIVHSMNTVGAKNIQHILPDAQIIPFHKLI